jgi:hypothetical protein
VGGGAELVLPTPLRLTPMPPPPRPPSVQLLTLASHVFTVGRTLLSRSRSSSSHPAAAAGAAARDRLTGVSGFTTALLDLWPAFALVGITSAWLKSNALAPVVDAHLPAFVLAHGCIFSLAACKVMFAHVSGEAFAPFHAGFILLGLPPLVLALEATAWG